MANGDEDIQTPTDMLNKLSAALILISRGDPIVSLRSELTTKFESIETRFDGIDRATVLQHEDTVRVPTLVDRAVKEVRELLYEHIDFKIAVIAGALDSHIRETAEKFAGVAAQFSERDTRTDQRAGDTKLAVDAAFAAAKEATAKIEAGFTKQIDSMIGTVDTKTANLDGRINDLKEAIVQLQNRATPTDPAVTAALSNISHELSSLQSYRDTTTGRASVSDPAMVEALRDLKNVIVQQNVSKGNAQGMLTIGQVVVGMAAVVAVALSAVALFLHGTAH